ncbi:hypothetical protein SB6095_04017 [Klebsiella quasivariicola]|nr:hypothetical protein SB6095_04017 [Klebsiella quasivariicola]
MLPTTNGSITNITMCSLVGVGLTVGQMTCSPLTKKNSGNNFLFWHIADTKTSHIWATVLALMTGNCIRLKHILFL